MLASLRSPLNASQLISCAHIPHKVRQPFLAALISEDLLHGASNGVKTVPILLASQLVDAAQLTSLLWV